VALAIDESGMGAVSWIQRMSLSSLAVWAHRLSKSDMYLDLSDSDEMADLVTDYLVHGMIAANHEMTRADAAWLLELVVLSLSRLSPKDTVNHGLAPGSALAAIVGHVSGRMEDMMRDLKKKDSNPLLCCFTKKPNESQMLKFDFSKVVW
jgi:phage terminase Nu1 subunit (DNA packaging protein)